MSSAPPRPDPASPPRPSRAGRALAILLVIGAGCGSPPPAGPADDATRHRRLVEAARSGEASSLDELFRVALKDPNEFLRGKALEAIYARQPEGRLPPGALLALERMAAEDPDFTRRQAARVLLHYRGAEALATAAEVWTASGNPATRQALAEAAASSLTEPELAAALQDRTAAMRGLADRAAAVAAARAEARLKAFRERRRTGRLAPRVRTALAGTPPAAPPRPAPAPSSPGPAR